jgi:[acyl-carrier-protein] S-malonyltransferase
MTRAFIFPGQGSQFVGMGKSLNDSYDVAKQVFEEVDDALNQKLSTIMFEGSEDDLRLTTNTQPALMALSMAIIRILENGGVKVANVADYVAGHSLGEYSALAAAGSLTLSDTAQLLRIRGNAMQKAVPVGEGAMAALLGLNFDVASEVCAEAASEGGVCDAANDNADGQVVVSGEKQAVERAIEIAKERGAKRGILLPVSAPFHCSMMQPAADAMAEALVEVTVKSPTVPLIANVKADVVTDPEEIKSLLVAQVTGSVRWRESVLKMGTLGVEILVEIGAGKVLSGLNRRINRDLTSINIQSPEDIDAFTSSL